MRRKKRRRKNRILPIILVIACVIAAAVAALCITGTFPGTENTASAEKNGQRTAYVCVNSQNAVIDSNGKVLEILAEGPSDVVKIEGLNLGIPVLGEILTCDNEENFQYALDIAVELGNNDMLVNSILINQDGEAEILFGKVEVKLGADSKTADKIRDLRDLYTYIKDLCGILNMENINDSLGYTFKKTEDTTAVEADAVQDEIIGAEERTEDMEDIAADDYYTETEEDWTDWDDSYSDGEDVYDYSSENNDEYSDDEMNYYQDDLYYEGNNEENY